MICDELWPMIGHSCILKTPPTTTLMSSHHLLCESETRWLIVVHLVALDSHSVQRGWLLIAKRQERVGG